MKARVSLLALSLALGMAIAQDAPQPPSQPKSNTPNQNMQKQDTQANASSATTGTAPAEMKTTTFKGTLVDLSCAGGASSSTAATPAEGKSGEPANTANRSSDSSCTPSANSTEFGMKMKDGHTVRFDLVGNQRAQDQLKNDKHWSKDVAAGKPINATVSGVLNGDKLIVSSIH